MSRYRDPRAPEGRVVFGGVAFIDGVTDDFSPGEGTLQLFKGAGIVEEPRSAPADPVAEQDEAETPKPAPRKKK